LLKYESCCEYLTSMRVNQINYKRAHVNICRIWRNSRNTYPYVGKCRVCSAWSNRRE